MSGEESDREKSDRDTISKEEKVLQEERVYRDKLYIQRSQDAPGAGLIQVAFDMNAVAALVKSPAVPEA